MKILWQEGDHKTVLTNVLMKLEGQTVTVHSEDKVNYLYITGKLESRTGSRYWWHVKAENSRAIFHKQYIINVTTDSVGTHIHIRRE